MIALLKKVVFSLICIYGCSAGLSYGAVVVDGSRIMDQPMTENLCALTFDDGPGPFTPALLDMLKANDIPATFFMLGAQANHYPEIVRRVVAEGHEIGNHSWSHPNLKRLGYEGQQRQIVETDQLLRSLGATPLFMRPPYGSFDDNTIKINEELGTSLILWSLDSLDWKRLPADYAKIPSTLSTVYDTGDLRGVFLFHDIHKRTVDDFPRILADLRAGGCERFVTVSDYLRGILDPEPGLLMTRHFPKNDKSIDLWMIYAAGSGPVSLARCSRPWQDPESAKTEENDIFEEAHAAVNKRIAN